jgi:hypothetical protein
MNLGKVLAPVNLTFGYKAFSVSRRIKTKGEDGFGRDFFSGML